MIKVKKELREEIEKIKLKHSSKNEYKDFEKSPHDEVIKKIKQCKLIEKRS